MAGKVSPIATLSGEFLNNFGDRCNERAAPNAAHVPTGERNQARRRGLDSPRYEAEVAEPLGMRLQILFGVVGMSMWLTP